MFRTAGMRFLKYGPHGCPGRGGAAADSLASEPEEECSSTWWSKSIRTSARYSASERDGRPVGVVPWLSSPLVLAALAQSSSELKSRVASVAGRRAPKHAMPSGRGVIQTSRLVRALRWRCSMGSGLCRSAMPRTFLVSAFGLQLMAELRNLFSISCRICGGVFSHPRITARTRRWSKEPSLNWAKVSGKCWTRSSASVIRCSAAPVPMPNMAMISAVA